MAGHRSRAGFAGSAARQQTDGGSVRLRRRLRNHLPVDAQVPAGIGTATEADRCGLPPSGCPGFLGPVPQPVWMDVRSLTA